MSQSDSMAEGEEAAEGLDVAAGEPPRRSRRKRLILLALAVLLLIGGGGAAAFFFLGHPADRVDDEAAIAAEEEAPATFVDVPPMQVQVRTADGGSRMLKLHVMLVPGNVPAETLTARLPQLIDRFQPFLRELRPEDLAGSAATFRVKEELLIRSNQALGTGAVRDVLIQDLMQA